MAGKLVSSSWYRVVNLKPRLREHTKMCRHRYRGRVWMVVSDPVTGRTHRFTQSAQLILNGMDGQRSVGELWEISNRRLGEDAPTQDELIHLLGQLHAADLMQCDVSPDVSELLFRAQRHERTKKRQMIGNPMSIKLPLMDPDRLLDRLRPLIQPVWNRWGMLLWLIVVAPATILALLNSNELNHNISDRVLATNNLLMLALIFPLIKVLHELGHAVSAKMRGAEVHETGVMFLMFVPVPYVDASAATTFKNKTDRALVGAAGMLVEIFVAALAMYVWLLTEPGMLRSVAFNTMLVAGISTVVFNGNPLLRFDGYYVLADLIEIPNLATRANRYIGYLVERYCFRAREAEAPHATDGEKAWFVFYAPASFIYRTAVSIAIILFIAGEFFAIGVVLAAWSFITTFVMPLSRLVGHLLSSPTLRPVRTRAYTTTATALAVVFAFIAWVPMPFHTHAEGIVWLPEQATVKAGANGFLNRFLAEPSSMVTAGTPLVRSVDPALEAQLRESKAKVEEQTARFNALFVSDRTAAELARQDMQREQSALARLQDRAENLVVRSSRDGQFMVPQASDMVGRYHHKGELLAYVLNEARPVVRVVVPQEAADIVRSLTRRVELRNAYRIDEVIVGTVMRELPGGAMKLPSRALTLEGGGQIVADPRDSQGLTALKHTFQLDIDLPADGLMLYGGRVYVRFEHLKRPLGEQWYRRIKPIFLSLFNG